MLIHLQIWLSFWGIDCRTIRSLMSEGVDQAQHYSFALEEIFAGVQYDMIRAQTQNQESCGLLICLIMYLSANQPHPFPAGHLVYLFSRLLYFEEYTTPRKLSVPRDVLQCFQQRGLRDTSWILDLLGVL